MSPNNPLEQHKTQKNSVENQTDLSKTQGALVDLEKKIKEYAHDKHIDASLNNLGKEIEKSKEKELIAYLEDADKKKLSLDHLETSNPEQFQLLHIKSADILFKIYAKVISRHKGRNQHIDKQKAQHDLSQLSLNDWESFVELITDQTLSFDRKSIKTNLNLSPEDKQFLDLLMKNKSFSPQYQKSFPQIIQTTKNTIPSLIDEYNSADSITDKISFEKIGDKIREIAANNPKALLWGTGILTGFTILNWMSSPQDKRTRKEYIGDTLDPRKSRSARAIRPLMGYFGIKAWKNGSEYFGTKESQKKEKSNTQSQQEPTSPEQTPIPPAITPDTPPAITPLTEEEPSTPSLQEQINQRINQLKGIYPTFDEKFLTARATHFLEQEKIPAEQRKYQLSQFTFEGKNYYIYEDQFVSTDKQKTINFIDNLKSKELEKQTIPLSAEEQKEVQEKAEKEYNTNRSETLTLMRMWQLGFFPDVQSKGGLKTNSFWSRVTDPLTLNYKRAKRGPQIQRQGTEYLAKILTGKLKQELLDLKSIENADIKHIHNKQALEKHKYQLEQEIKNLEAQGKNYDHDKFQQSYENLKKANFDLPESLKTQIQEDIAKKIEIQEQQENKEQAKQEIETAEKNLEKQKADLDEKIKKADAEINTAPEGEKQKLREQFQKEIAEDLKKYNIQVQETNLKVVSQLSKLDPISITDIGQNSKLTKALLKANKGADRLLKSTKAGKVALLLTLGSLVRSTGANGVSNISKGKRENAAWEIGDTAVGFVPIAGNINDIIVLIRGKTHTGEKLTTYETIMRTVGAIPLIGNVAKFFKLGGKIVKGSKYLEAGMQSAKLAKNGLVIYSALQVGVMPIAQAATMTLSEGGKRMMQSAENKLTPPTATH